MIALVLAVALVLPTGAFAAPSYTTTVDAGTSTGAIKYGGIGWLYGLSSDTQPKSSDISGVYHPGYAGQMAPDGAQHPDGDAFKVTANAKRGGIKGIDIYMQDFYSEWPYQNNGITSYVNNVIKPTAQKVVASSDRSYYRYVLFNEPDWIWYAPSGSKFTQFCNDWKTAYQALRSVDSSGKIIGPAFCTYSASAYDAFFKFAKDNNCLPDITAWHELSAQGPTPFDSNYSNYRSIESKYGISAREVYINEYGRQTGEMARPGRMIQYLARFEKAKVWAGMAAWGKIGYLDDLIGTDNKQTGGYHLYRWYGQMAGNTVSLTNSDSTGCNQAMACRNGGNNVKVIFGGSLYDSDVYTQTVKVNGLSGSSVPYTIYGTDYTTTEKLAYTVSSGTATISGGTATITVPNCKSLSAYMVQMGSW